MRRFRFLSVLALALAAACGREPTGPDADPRLTGTWVSAPVHQAASSGAAVPGTYQYVLHVDGRGGYQWDAAVHGGRGEMKEIVGYVRSSGRVSSKGARLLFHPTFSVARNRFGGDAPQTPLGGSDGRAVEATFQLSGGKLLLNVSQPGDRLFSGKTIQFRRRSAL